MAAAVLQQVPRCEARYLGVVPYAEGLRLQAELVERRAAGLCDDQLLLLEHPHVLTLGRNAKAAHVLADPVRLAGLGVELFECGRGGDVTYHGPGQLVAYPIIGLDPRRRDLRRYVRDLEEVLLRVLAGYGIVGHRVPGKTGVWVERHDLPPAKVAAIGVRVSRWVTSHGIALNVRTDLRYFDLIVPCGLAGSAVTSLAELLPEAPEVPDVAARFAAEFGAVYGRQMSLR